VTVTSTLDHLAQVPERIRWIATIQPASTTVDHVDYLIDGKVAWTETSAPYVYGGDDDGANLGYLITTWLQPGAHTFTVRVVGGAQAVLATDQVRAQTVAGAAPPAGLAGVWSRVVPGSPGGPPTGRWRLAFDNVGAWELDTLGTGVVSQIGVTGNRIDVYAPISMAPFNDGVTGINAYGNHDIGGVDCNASGPFGSYTWTVNGRSLTLSPVNEACPDRQGIWAGTWTRAS
jgi:hypothetical protein